MQKSDSFYNLETLGGMLLFIAAVIAMIFANSPYSAFYQQFITLPVVKHPLIWWINDGLMAIYFLVIGLEIKREMNRGVLSKKSDVVVPAITALCGMLVPASIFIFINHNYPDYLHGWAIPTATDIAFSLGILALLGSRVPLSLKILLTAIAIFDDMGAIVIIAIFYTSQLTMPALIMAIFLTGLLFLLNYFKFRQIYLYLFIGVILWMAVLQSGVHATIAGILLAMTIPDDAENSMLAKIENCLHPWIVFLILPLFAFANAGFSILDFHSTMLLHPVVLGVSLGLLFGKQIGIFLPLSYFVKRRGFLQSEQISLRHVYGIALICGVGFTMSLFIGTLAYQRSDVALMSLVKVGVMLGSLLAGSAGYFVLKTTSSKAAKSSD